MNTQLTQTGLSIGTPAYMAPEQAKEANRYYTAKQLQHALHRALEEEAVDTEIIQSQALRQSSDTAANTDDASKSGYHRYKIVLAVAVLLISVGVYFILSAEKPKDITKATISWAPETQTAESANTMSHTGLSSQDLEPLEIQTTLSR